MHLIPRIKYVLSPQKFKLSSHVPGSKRYANYCYTRYAGTISWSWFESKFKGRTYYCRIITRRNYLKLVFKKIIYEFLYRSDQARGGVLMFWSVYPLVPTTLLTNGTRCGAVSNNINNGHVLSFQVSFSVRFVKEIINNTLGRKRGSHNCQFKYNARKWDIHENPQGGTIAQFKA